MENQQSLQEQPGQEQTGQEQAGQNAPAAAASRVGVVAIRGNVAADAELKRKRQALELQRELVLSQRTSSPHRRTALEAALLEIEEKLGELGWTLHL